MNPAMKPHSPDTDPLALLAARNAQAHEAVRDTRAFIGDQIATLERHAKDIARESADNASRPPR